MGHVGVHVSEIAALVANNLLELFGWKIEELTAGVGNRRAWGTRLWAVLWSCSWHRTQCKSQAM